METMYLIQTFQEIAYSFASVYFVLALVFMLLDVITGLVKAIATKSFSSSKMRQGFFRKMSVIIVLIVAALADAFIAAGIGSLGINEPVFKIACGYIAIMEIASILENVAEINPSLANSKLLNLFSGVKDKASDNNA